MSKVYGVIGLIRQIAVDDVRNVPPKGLEECKYIVHAFLQIMIQETDRRMQLEEERLRREARNEAEIKKERKETADLEQIWGKIG